MWQKIPLGSYKLPQKKKKKDQMRKIRKVIHILNLFDSIRELPSYDMGNYGAQRREAQRSKTSIEAHSPLLIQDQSQGGTC